MPSVRGRLDINNDGQLENVYIAVHGTAQSSEVVVYDDHMRKTEWTKSPDDDWNEGDLRWSLDVSLLHHGSQWYIVGAYEDRLGYVSRIGPDNVERVLCRFETLKPKVRLVKGARLPVCRAAQRGSLTFVDFNIAHSVTAEDALRSDWPERSPAPLAANVDLDNDGQSELVVPLKRASAGGRGCAQSELRVLDASGTNFAHTNVAKLLADLEGDCRGSSLRPFIFERVTYLQNKYEDGAPSGTNLILRLREKGFEEVCRINANRVQRAVPRPIKP